MGGREAEGFAAGCVIGWFGRPIRGEGLVTRQLQHFRGPNGEGDVLSLNYEGKWVFTDLVRTFSPLFTKLKICSHIPSASTFEVLPLATYQYSLLKRRCVNFQAGRMGEILRITDRIKAKNSR